MFQTPVETSPIPLRSVDVSPVPPGCTMTGLPYMPLDIDRLNGSRSWTRARRNPQMGYYLMCLWMAAWKGHPAGSLEDDDDILCAAAQCEPSVWAEVRTEAMRGWLRCSADGRVYHPVVSQVATGIWNQRTEYRDSMARARAAKAAKRARGEPAQKHMDLPTPATTAEPVVITTLAPTSQYPDRGDCSAARNETPVKAAAEPEILPKERSDTEHGQAFKCEVRKERTRLRLDAASGLVTGTRAQLWCDGLADLRTMTGLNDSKGRGLLGRLLKRAGDDCGLVRRVLDEAIDMGPMDPVAWLTAAVETRAGRGQLSELDQWAEDMGIGDIDDLPKFGDLNETLEWERNRNAARSAPRYLELAQAA